MVDSQKRIAGAFLIGGILVAGAFAVASLQEKEAQKNTQSAITAVERTHIEITDANKDGIPDWQEVLQKSDPIVIAEATSTYETPKTVTGKFAISFFEDFLRSKNYGAFGDSQEELIQEATEALAKEAIDELFTEKDIIIVDDSNSETLRAYGNRIASIAIGQHSGSDGEAIILQDALRYNDPERLKDLEPIALSYINMIKQMLETPVPEAYAKQHLDLLNTYNAIRADIKGMQKLYDDPMYTFLRMKRYEDDVIGMSNALVNLFNALYLKGNIRWDENEPVSQLIEFSG